MNLLKLPSGCYLNTEQIVSISAPSSPEGNIVVSTTNAVNVYRKEDANAIFQWAEIASAQAVIWKAGRVVAAECSMCHTKISPLDFQSGNYHIDEQGDRICHNCLKGKHADLPNNPHCQLATDQPCPACDGTGGNVLSQCPACSGSGKVQP